jgi:hypothetical protein
MAADWMSSGFAFEAGDRRTLAERVLDRTVWSGWHSGAEPRALLEGWSPHAASRPVWLKPAPVPPSGLMFGPMIEQSLAAPYGHHLMAKTIIAIMSNGDIT